MPEARLDTPLSYEAMTAIGSGLGAAGFIVFDDETDFVAVAARRRTIPRGRVVRSVHAVQARRARRRQLLDRIARSDGEALDLLSVDEHLQTITDGARCFLATQHQRVVGSLVSTYPDAFQAHIDGATPPVDVMLIAPMTELHEQRATLDDSQRDKQPDWTHDSVDSGKSPAERLENEHGPALVPHRRP